MTALLNPSFEDAGALPGDAAHWTLTAFTSLEVVAGFGTAPEKAWEDFADWYPFLGGLADVPVVLAFFDGNAEGFEDFEEGWANNLHLLELPPAQLVPCPFGGGLDVEDCETGWSNAAYARDWALVTSVTGLFDGQPREAFDVHWRSNEAYARTWETLPASAALFDGGQQGVEAFDGTWTHATTQ